MSSTIVVGYDGAEPAARALDRAIEEARSVHGKLLVVSVAEMPLNPEGLQNFGTLDDSPPRLVLIEPAELEPLLEEARVKVAAAGLSGDFVWAAGEPASAIVGAAKERHARLIVLGSAPPRHVQPSDGRRCRRSGEARRGLRRSGRRVS